RGWIGHVGLPCALMCRVGPGGAENTCASNRRTRPGSLRLRIGNCPGGAGSVGGRERRRREIRERPCLRTCENRVMTTLKSKLQEDLNAAIRGRDELRSSTLRLTLAAITKEEVAGKEKRELSDDEVQKVITREAKKRREAAEAFAQGGRAEQAERERAEGEVLAQY